jgi:DNA-binding transcriptional LysR family regulator
MTEHHVRPPDPHVRVPAGPTRSEGRAVDSAVDPAADSAGTPSGPAPLDLRALDVTALRLMRAIADHGSLTAAAAAVGSSQPAVSQQVRRLERRLGTALLERAGRSVRLTEAGRVLAHHGAAVTAAVHAAAAEVTSLTTLRAGRVRLVAFPSASATLVPRALADLRRRHPGLAVTLDEAEPPQALDALRSGACDLVLVFAYPPVAGDGAGRAASGGGRERPAGPAGPAGPDGPDGLDGLVARHLLDDDSVVALPADHPAARGDEPDLADLADDVWIAGCPRCRGSLLAAGRARGFTPQVAYATDDYVAVLGLVAAGLGVALLPGLVLPTALRTPGVVVRRAGGTVGRTVHAVTTPDLLRVPAVAAALDALERAATAHATAGGFPSPVSPA